MLLFGLDSLSQFVGKNERRAVLAIQIAAQLKRGVTLGAVGKYRDGKKIIPNRPFTVRKDRPGSDRELMRARPAFPNGTSPSFLTLRHPHCGQ